MITKRRTKCRMCKNYRRVKKGHWSEPDWKSKAGICIYPGFLSCDYRYNILGPQNHFKLRRGAIKFNLKKQLEHKQIIIDIINRHQDFIVATRKKSISERLKMKPKKKTKPRRRT